MDKIFNTKRNIFWGVVNRITSVVFSFVIRTVIIYTLGMEYLGLGSLFASILQMLNMAEMGLSSVIVFSMYKPIAEKNTAKICSLMLFYKRAYSSIGIVVMLGGSMLIPILDRLINGGYPNDINIYFLYLLYLFNTCISYSVLGYKYCLLMAHQRNDLDSKIGVATNICQCGLQIIILFLFKNYYLYYIFFPVFSVLRNIMIAIVTQKMYPTYKGAGKLDSEEKVFIKKSVTGLFLGKVCLISRNSLDSIFISMFIGLTAVAIYGNYFYVLSSVNRFLQIILSSMAGGIGNNIATFEKNKNYHDMRTIDFLFTWLVDWCAVCMVILYQPFMKLWIGGNQLLSNVDVILFALYFYIENIGLVRLQYSSAIGLWWESRFYVFTELVANILLNYILGKYFGITGIIVATILTMFGCNFLWGSKIAFKYYFGIKKIKDYFLTHLKHYLVMCVAAILTYYICKVLCVNLDNVLCFLFRGIICLIVPNIVFLFFFRKFKEYNDAIILLKKMWSKNNLKK